MGRAIAKSVRADLHERIAEWIAVRTRDIAGEYEEILGWHFDQAYAYHVELGEISSYPPGYKENAGIFCHTNPWLMIGEAIDGSPVGRVARKTTGR